MADLGKDGPASSIRGWRAGLTPEGSKLFLDSGHGLDVPHMFLQNRTNLSQGWQRASEIAGWMFNRVETGNRKYAYLTGLDVWFKRNGQRVGMTFEDALRRGSDSIPKQALDFADDLVRKTQFRYGKVDLPLILRQEIVGTALQFSSFAIKASELMWKWGTREGRAGRLKLFSFIAYAGAFQTLGGLAGFPTLGDGTASPLDVPEMAEFMFSMGEGDWTRAKAAALNTFDFDPLTIGFGPAVSGIQEGAEVLRKAREGLPVREAAQRFALNEVAPVALKRILQASDQGEAGGGWADMLSATLGLPTSNAILRQQAIRLVEQGNNEQLKDFIQAIREAHGGLPKNFISGSFRRKAKRELAIEQRRKKREKGRETALDKQIRERFTRTEKLLRNRFVRPIGGF